MIIFTKIGSSTRRIIFIITTGSKLFLIGLIIWVVWHLSRQGLAVRGHEKNSPTFGAGMTGSRSSVGAQSLIHFVGSNSEFKPIIFVVCRNGIFIKQRFPGGGCVADDR